MPIFDIGFKGRVRRAMGASCVFMALGERRAPQPPGQCPAAGA